MELLSEVNTYDTIEDDSLSDDVGNDTSSDDEIAIILHGTPEQRRKLQRLHNRPLQRRQLSDQQPKPLQDDLSSSEDEFEKEMNAELNQQVRYLENTRGDFATKPSLTISEQPASSEESKTSNIPESSGMTEEFYDEIYFDSDDEEDETAGSKSSRKHKHAVISNDDLLYDPNMDDEDQKWVDLQRLSHHNQGVTRGKKGKIPNSDGLLDCPACMTTLCLDCQRHETYKHQYRAMFVMNCKVDKSETLQCPEQAPKKKKKKRKTKDPAQDLTSQGSSASTDLFYPVRCTECNTVVGVIDHDEVYHFFNVLASYT